LVSVHELVHQVTEKVRVEKGQEYKLIGVKWYGEGTFHKETAMGDKISATYLTPVISNAFIYNRLFAWKESFAVVPPEHEGHFVSNEFPQFVVDESRILARYLYLFFTLDSTIRAVNAASVGSAAVSRNRFKEEEFLKFEIPLPPLETQQAIVTRWQQAQAEIEAAKASLQQVNGDLNGLLVEQYRAVCKQDVIGRRWLAMTWKDIDCWDVKTARATTFRTATPSFRPLGDFAEEATELVKPWEQPDKDWPVYGVNNKEGVFFSHYQRGKDFNAAYKRIRKDWFFHNPTRSSVGSLGIVPDVPEDALTSPEYQVWHIKQGMIPGYVAVLINTPFFISLIQFHRVGAVKQRLYVENLLEIRVPVVSKDEQLRVAAAREAALQQVATAEVKAEATRAEVEALILGTRKL
jgi:hypothetical protein